MVNVFRSWYVITPLKPFANFSYCSVPILLDLSTVLSSLSISQTLIGAIDYNSNHFLGLSDMRWAPIFIVMLSKKLDKLKIGNAYLNYLSLPGANHLIEVNSFNFFD